MRAEHEIDRWSEMDAVLGCCEHESETVNLLVDLCSYPQLWSRNITEIIVAVMKLVRSSG